MGEYSAYRIQYHILLAQCTVHTGRNYLCKWRMSIGVRMAYRIYIYVFTYLISWTSVTIHKHWSTNRIYWLFSYPTNMHMQQEYEKVWILLSFLRTIFHIFIAQPLNTEWEHQWEAEATVKEKTEIECITRTTDSTGTNGHFFPSIEFEIVELDYWINCEM